MLIYIGADHKGWDLKEEIKKGLMEQGYQPQDMGNKEKKEDDDYVDFSKAVARAVASSSGARGIVICGSGAGVDITANKIRGIRSVLGFKTDQVFDAREDDDVNVLALPADFLGVEEALYLIKVFLTTPFSGEERHKRRIEKITAIELEN